MQALIRFCALFDLDLDVYRKTINKRKFEEYSKRTGEKRYRYKDDKSDAYSGIGDGVATDECRQHRQQSGQHEHHRLQEEPNRVSGCSVSEVPSGRIGIGGR